MATAGILDREIRHPDHFFIDGDWTVPSGSTSFEIVSPATEEVFLTVAEAQAPDVDRAIAAARRAFDNGPWPRLSHAERATYLREIGKRLLERSADLSRIWTSEMGIISAMSDAMVPIAGNVWDYYASLADTFEFEERHVPQAGGNIGLLVREPVGVVTAIVPWNGPLMLIAYKVAPALLAGCTVILKASPEAPGSAYVMAEIAEEVRLPKGVLNVLTADREVSELLVRSPDVDKVSFTGSSAAGQKIGAICGGRIARCTLELGGKSAAVIFDDYDLGSAAQSLADSACLMTGQVCASLTRVVVSRDRQNELLDEMASRFSAIRIGDPFDAAIDMGPLAMARQRDKVESYLAKGRAEGARLVTGGARPAHLNRGFFVEPTVFGDVDNNMTIAREEIFGPVVSVIPAENETQAIEIANDTVYGLNASIFTNDPDRAYRAARELRSGTVGHNAFRSDFSIAFGGFKQSGIGREGGTEGLMPFLETKTIILEEAPSHLR